MVYHLPKITNGTQRGYLGVCNRHGRWPSTVTRGNLTTAVSPDRRLQIPLALHERRACATKLLKSANRSTAHQLFENMVVDCERIRHLKDTLSWPMVTGGNNNQIYEALRCMRVTMMILEDSHQRHMITSKTIPFSTNEEPSKASEEHLETLQMKLDGPLAGDAREEELHCMQDTRSTSRQAAVDRLCQ